MLKQLSVMLAVAGFAGFMAVFGLAAHHPAHAHAFAWPMMAAVWSMAAGMLGLCITLNRQQRAEVLARRKS